MALQVCALITSLMEAKDLFLSHGFTPDSLILCTMISIPKDMKKYYFSSSNYRAITLSSILNNILDWIMLLKEHKASPLQFGFKKGLSTRVLDNVLIACLKL